GGAALPEGAGLRDQGSRDGGGAGRPVRGAGGLWGALRPVGGRAPRRGPVARARRALLPDDDHGHQGVAGPPGQPLLDEPVPELPPGTRPPPGLPLILVRVVPVRRRLRAYGAAARAGPRPARGRAG